MQASALTISYVDKVKFYREVELEASGLLETEWLMNLANLAALLKQQLPATNWIGFYLNKNQELILGPFQGLPACSRIAFGKGVCGTAAIKKETIIVDDVDQFPGHIVCDGASRSEIVIPLVSSSSTGVKVIGVLDIDSPELSRFDEADRLGLESLVRLLMKKTDWNSSPLQF